MENNVLQHNDDNSISITIQTAFVQSCSDGHPDRYLEYFPLYMCGSSFCQEAQDIESEGVTFSVCACACVCVFQVGHSFMRVSLTLKPNSRSDFGFQTHRDATGATVQFIQPGETFCFMDGCLVLMYRGYRRRLGH